MTRDIEFLEVDEEGLTAEEREQLVAETTTYIQNLLRTWGGTK